MCRILCLLRRFQHVLLYERSGIERVDVLILIYIHTRVLRLVCACVSELLLQIGDMELQSNLKTRQIGGHIESLTHTETIVVSTRFLAYVRPRVARIKFSESFSERRTFEVGYQQVLTNFAVLQAFPGCCVFRMHQTASNEDAALQIRNTYCRCRFGTHQQAAQTIRSDSAY
jgi:hypothetical protein